LTPHSTSESESEVVKVDQKKDEHEFDPKLFEHIDAPPEIKEIFEFIPRFTPQRIIIDYKLKVFIPEYIPAVGDIDAFLKCNEPTTPIEENTGDQKIAAFIKKLGLEILDEPCGEQSDPVLLQMKLRAIYPKAMETPSSVAKSPKDVDRWISEIQALHASQPSQNLLMKKSLPNIDHLMTEWPEEMEKMLETVGFPAANLDVSLKTYIEIVCGIFDIPLANTAKHSDYVAALYTLFNLFIAVRGQSRVHQ
jgi:intraflagellar transport protein 46